MKKLLRRLLFCVLIIPTGIVALPCLVVCAGLDFIAWIVTGKDLELEMGGWTDKTIFIAFKLLEN